MPDGDPFMTLLKYISLNGFPEVPASVKLYTSLSPCDKSLGDVTNQCVTFLSRHRGCPVKDFTFLSNYSAFLALSWLIAKYDLTELLLETTISNVESSPKKSTCTLVEPQDVETQDIKVACNKIVWALGRLRLVLKNLAAQHQCEAQLVHKVHERTVGLSLLPDANHLTVSQIRNLACPGDMAKFQCRIQHAYKVISNYLAWKEEEPSFWAWILSLTSQTEPPDDFKGFVSAVQQKFSGPSLDVRQPILIHRPKADVSVQKATASLRQQLRAAELELERVQRRTKAALTELGFSYKKATFMP